MLGLKSPRRAGLAEGTPSPSPRLKRTAAADKENAPAAVVFCHGAATVTPRGSLRVSPLSQANDNSSRRLLY